jgi:hypothetical protein
MIEIVFSDSVCGSLRRAQYYGEGSYRGGGIVVLFSSDDGRTPTKEEREAAQRDAEEQARLSWESATPLGGNPGDVYGFNLALSIGDIAGNTLGSQRQQVLEQLYSTFPQARGDEMAQDLLQRAKANLHTVCERVAAGEALRIWYSDQPDELCGLYWFMTQLNGLGVCCGQVYLVKFPAWEADEHGYEACKAGWGALDAGEWHRYLALQRPVPLTYCQGCASHWQALQKENTPLRAVLNGRLVSVPETIYDDVIRREIEAEGDEFQEATIILRVLSRYQLGLGDAWVAFRIEEMVRAGMLEVVSEAAQDMPVYRRTLKKCTHRWPAKRGGANE